MIKVFYVPDGHRRYAEREKCSLTHAYRLGYRVLLDEVIRPVLEMPEVSELGVFLLSSLNLERRRSADLNGLLREGERLLAALIDECQPFANITTFGNYLRKNLQLTSSTSKRLNLVLGTRCREQIDCEEADMFLRSGGEMRLSGAPRTLIGDYTQFYTIDALHPDLRFDDISDCFRRYKNRYMRECAPVGQASGQ